MNTCWVLIAYIINIYGSIKLTHQGWNKTHKYFSSWENNALFFFFLFCSPPAICSIASKKLQQAQSFNWMWWSPSLSSTAVQPKLHCLAFSRTSSATEMTNPSSTVCLLILFPRYKLVSKLTLIWGSQDYLTLSGSQGLWETAGLNNGYYLSLQPPSNWKQHQLGWVKKATNCWQHLKLWWIPLETCASRHRALVSPALQQPHQCQAFTQAHTSDFSWSTVWKHSTKLICTAVVPCPAS